MKYNLKKVLTIGAIIGVIIAMPEQCFAHSGRTDSNGGHKDKQNKSGLGSYHYHCGGYPAHLHDNGVCTYSSSSSNNSSSKSSSNKTSTSTSDKSSGESTITTSPSMDTQKLIMQATDIEINNNITNMRVGENSKLTATIIPENTEDKSIIWSSSDEGIATVSSSGKVVALKSGVVNITATTSNKKTDTMTITVEEENNTTVVSIQSDELNSSNTNKEDSDMASSLLGLGLIGGGSYWGYKKYKNKKAKNILK